MSESSDTPKKTIIASISLGFLLGSALMAWIFSIVAAQSAGSSAEKVLKLAHVLDQEHPVHLAMEYMAERLEEISGGKMVMEIFPNGQLGSETDSIEQVQEGVIDMVKTSTAPMEGFIPEMALFGLPYLFRNEEHYWNVLNGEIGTELLNKGTESGLRGLCYYDSGSRSFYTIDKPVLHPRDLKGMKIRVMRSKMAMNMISQMGGSPAPIPWGELYTALQQGMVDGAENNPPSFFTSRHFEVVKHYSLDEHTRIPDIILFSEKSWQALSPQEQEWMSQAADDSVVYQREVWREQTLANLEALKAAGVTVYNPDKEPFRQIVKPLYKPFEGTPIGEYVKKIQEVQ